MKISKISFFFSIFWKNFCEIFFVKKLFVKKIIFEIIFPKEFFLV